MPRVNPGLIVMKAIKITRENYFKETRIEFAPVDPKQAIELLDGLKSWRRKKTKSNIVTSFGEFEVDFQSENTNAWRQSRSLSFYFVNVATNELIRISDHWTESQPAYSKSDKLNCGYIRSCSWRNMHGERFDYRIPGQKWTSVLIAGITALEAQTRRGFSFQYMYKAMETPAIRSSRWQQLSNEDIVKLFDRYFDDVAIQPNAAIVAELRLLKSATLELLEDRWSSSVYRIRETGVVFQIEQENGEYWVYDSYEDYLSDPPMDELRESFVRPPKTYEVIDQQGDIFTIKRNKPPRFKAKYNRATGDIELFDKEDAFDPFLAPNYARRIGEMVSKFLKAERR